MDALERLTCAVISLGLLFGPVAYADELPPPSAKAPSETVKGMEDFLKKIPGTKSADCLMKDFTGILMPGSYQDALSALGGNRGLVDHFLQAQKDSPELAQQALAFYSEVDNVTKLAEPNIAALENMPYLYQEAGDKDHDQLAPGWVWKLALKTAGGDPNRAIELIGICGHDDVENGSILGPKLPEEQKAQKISEVTQLGQAALADLKATLDEPDSQSKNDSCSLFPIGNGKFMSLDSMDIPRLSSLNFQQFQTALIAAKSCRNTPTLQKLHDSLKQYFANGIPPQQFANADQIPCPSSDTNTDFFLPKNLGPKVDIPASLKKRLVKERYDPPPHNCPGGSCQPGKYYHVYGAAAVACEMIARGHSPLVVTEMSAAAGWFYRVLWITSKFASACPDAISTKPVSKGQVIGWSQTLQEVLHLGAKSGCKSPEAEPDLSEPPTTDYYSDDHVMCDAAELMRRETLSGNFGQAMGFLYTDLPSVSAILTGAAETDRGIPLLTEGANRPADWSRARYERAEQTVASIKADFTWTREQHRIGAQFAAQVCKPDQKMIAQSACGTLEKEKKPRGPWHK